MSITNSAPSAPFFNVVEGGLRTVRIHINQNVEADIAGTTFWYLGVEQRDTTASTIVDISVAEAVSSALIEGAFYDTLSDNNSLLLAKFGLNYTSQTISKKTPISITAVSQIDSRGDDWGSSPSSALITLSDSLDVLVEYNTDNQGWKALGRFSPTDNNTVTVTPASGSVHFRVKSIYIFMDGTEEIQSNWTTTTQATTIAQVINAPTIPSNISSQWLRVQSGLIERADLNISWDWIRQAADGNVREFKLYMAVSGTAGPSTVWTTTISTGLSQAYTFANLDVGTTYAFRVEAIAWDSNYVSDSLYGTASITQAAFNNLTLQGASTNVEITDYHIRGSNGGTQTFLLDAADGSLSLGANSEIDINPSGVVTVKGSVIADTITSANFEMSWLGGTAPSLYTSSKTSVSDTDAGLWMGYTDSSTFQMVIGDNVNFMKWDGTSLDIAGVLRAAQFDTTATLPSIKSEDNDVYSPLRVQDVTYYHATSAEWSTGQVPYYQLAVDAPGQGTYVPDANAQYAELPKIYLPASTESNNKISTRGSRYLNVSLKGRSAYQDSVVLVLVRVESANGSLNWYGVQNDGYLINFTETSPRGTSWTTDRVFWWLTRPNGNVYESITFLVDLFPPTNSVINPTDKSIQIVLYSTLNSASFTIGNLTAEQEYTNL